MSLMRLPFRSFVSLPALALATFAGAAPAAAQTFEGEGATAILEGIGILQVEKPEIDIKERGPLVIPNSADLPLPRASGAVTTSRPDWPNDPDELNKKSASVEKIWNEQARSGRRLTASEMQGDKIAATEGAKLQHPMGDRDRTLLTPEQLSNTHKLLAKKENWAEKGEPGRKVLSDPPSGYRTPSTSAPYAPPPAKGKESLWDKINPFD